MVFINQLEEATAKIEEALRCGMRLTSAEGNHLAHTVDFRKIVSRLRKRGLQIEDVWTEHNGHRFKIYYAKQTN